MSEYRGSSAESALDRNDYAKVRTSIYETIACACVCVSTWQRAARTDPGMLHMHKQLPAFKQVPPFEVYNSVSLPVQQDMFGAGQSFGELSCEEKMK